MIIQVLHCSYCQGTSMVRHGTTFDGPQRYRCREYWLGRGRTFLLDDTYAGQSPGARRDLSSKFDERWPYGLYIEAEKHQVGKEKTRMKQ